MTAPYYQDDRVTLFLGDCREVAEWLAADVLVTDPPYGRNWTNIGYNGKPYKGFRPIAGIACDEDLAVRDAALEAWGPKRPAVVFGDLLLDSPAGTRQVLIYEKPPGGGFMGAINGFFRDVEGIYLIACPGRKAERSSIIRSGSPYGGSAAKRYGHPHAKPVDVMETLIAACPPGVIADPFAGAGSTLVAARNLGRKAIGVELDERYCKRAAERLAQDVLDLARGDLTA
jgi:site-specific DNA-methyltransferase (adenine-specific)